MNAAEPRRTGGGPIEGSPMERALTEFADEARRAEASSARRQRSDEAVVSRLSGTFLGTLLELMETKRPAIAITRSGSNHRGIVTAVGIDVVVLSQSADERRTLLAPPAIEAIRSSSAIASRDSPGIDDGPRMADLLDSFGFDAARMALTTAGGNRLMGRIVSVGVDQLSLLLDGENEQLVVPIAAIDEAVIDP